MKRRLLVVLILGCASAPVGLTGCSVANSSARPGMKLSSHQEARPLTPTQVIHKYYELVSRGELEEAQKYRLTKLQSMSEDIGQSPRLEVGDLAIPPDSFEKFIYENKIELRELVREDVENNKAEVIAVLQYRNKGLRTSIHKLYRQNGEWKFYFDIPVDSPLCVQEPAACHIVLTPAAVVNWYYHYAAAGEVKKSREYLINPPDPDSGQSWHDAFGPGAEQTYGERDIAFGALESETIEGDKAVVTAQVLIEGKPVQVRHLLSKESSTWKILSYSKS